MKWLYHGWLWTSTLYDKYDATEYRPRTATKRLINENYFEAYDNVFKQCELDGIIEAVPIDQLAKEVHYLPHRPVIKPSSNTTKDASAILTTCAFLRCEFKGQVTVKLIAAKARLAPMQKSTIRRLELLGAALGARLVETVHSILQTASKTYF
ncbi:uncharacterized protein TNIN_21761 [Trichonephila inaurata madagascariensis]|uniref:Uncharacterized protein n=1 Tax=Trichonephila inaurata madagascariensis TaxID=2747483 RepID=A0A8X6YKQ0_9ARAC|nr:uncharacterized protein TNIN_21761 [Trichonephila inaurata madagascariensis]